MKQTKLIMGMPITLEIIEPVSEVVFTEVFTYFRAVDRRYSTYKANSEISRINRGLPRAEWSPEMRIRHLELRSAGAYLRRNFTYARARQRTKHLGQCDLLTPRECLRIFQGVCSGRSPLDRIALTLLLSSGRLTWTAGSML